MEKTTPPMMKTKERETAVSMRGWVMIMAIARMGETRTVRARDDDSVSVVTSIGAMLRAERPQNLRRMLMDSIVRQMPSIMETKVKIAENGPKIHSKLNPASSRFLYENHELSRAFWIRPDAETLVSKIEPNEPERFALASAWSIASRETFAHESGSRA